MFCNGNWVVWEQPSKLLHIGPKSSGVSRACFRLGRRHWLGWEIWYSTDSASQNDDWNPVGTSFPARNPRTSGWTRCSQWVPRWNASWSGARISVPDGLDIHTAWICWWDPFSQWEIHYLGNIPMGICCFMLFLFLFFWVLKQIQDYWDSGMYWWFAIQHGENMWTITTDVGPSDFIRDGCNPLVNIQNTTERSTIFQG